MNKLEFIMNTFSLSKEKAQSILEKLSFVKIFELNECIRKRNVVGVQKVLAEADNSFSLQSKMPTPPANSQTQANTAPKKDGEEIENGEEEIDPKTGKTIVKDTTSAGGMAMAMSPNRKS